jgi:DNA-binding CsgD family transcriptional regulator
MNDADLRVARTEMRRTGQPTQAVVDDLDRAVRAVIGVGRLPASLSPEGHWDGDVAEDLRQRWLTEKLLGDRDQGSELRALLEKADSARAFFSMARRSFYHWLLSHRERSQATNIYNRLIELLEANSEIFRIVRPAQRRQDRYWFLVDAGDPDPFAGSDRELAAAALGAGYIAPVRYSASSTRRSPLISSPDLLHFAQSMMRTLGRSLNASQIMRALATRLDLGDPHEISLDDMRSMPGVENEETADMRDAALSAIAQMKPRMLEILVRLDRGEQAQDIALQLGVSPATISADRRAAQQLLRTLSEDDKEMGSLLKCILDLLYEQTDA